MSGSACTPRVNKTARRGGFSDRRRVDHQRVLIRFQVTHLDDLGVKAVDDIAEFLHYASPSRS